MRYTNQISVLLLFVILTFVSCDKDEHTDFSTLDASTVTATLDANLPSTILEQDSTFVITISLDKPQVVDMKFYMSLLEGTATEGEDFDYDHEIVIPAYATSGSSEIKIYNDLTIEESETFTVVFGDTSTPNVNFVQAEHTITLENYVNPNLEMYFEWDAVLATDSGEVHFCDYVDLDVYVFDTDGNDLGIYDAATGACPEAMLFSGMADGDYILMTNLWSSGVIPDDPAVVVEFPITGTFIQGGLFEMHMTQSSENSFSSADGDSSDDFRPLANLSISNGTYTITAP
ncbi:MAG: hypothetical protein ACPG5B_02895 [Chitinophagales bacterium]